MPKLTDLPELTTASDDDILVIDDNPSSDTTTKKITRGNLVKHLATKAELEEHTEATDNPHQVTAEQVGAVSEGDFTDHTGNSAVHRQIDDASTSANDLWSAQKITTELAGKGSTSDVAANTAARHTHSNQAILDTTTASFTTTDETKLNGVEDGATANSSDAQLRDRSTHTGSQAISTITGLQTAIDGKADVGDIPNSLIDLDTTVTGTQLNALKTKVDGVASGATANDTDANLKNRANHTGSQTSSTISDFTTAADARISAQKGQNNGLASLDSGGKVPSAQLPSYVDDVLEYDTTSEFPATGSTGTIYVALDSSKTYRWSGSAYVEISPSPGSTDSVPEGSANKYYTEERVAANTTVATNTSARHTHANKALLDTYDQTNANLADAVSKKHSHANQAVLDATTASFTTVQQTKLSGVATGATANDTDANLKNRANHTGSQTISTVTGLQTALDGKLALTGGTVSGAINTTAGGSAGSGTQKLSTESYIQSRGQNLITNGFGKLKNNYNFSSFTYDPINLFAGNGAFARSGAGTLNNDETIPVDPSLTYELSAYVKETNGVSGTRFYLGVVATDSDDNAISAVHFMRQAGTDTYLAADLNPGDTTIHLVSAANWNNAAGAASYNRNIAVYGYANSAGYVYPNFTYTRRILSNAYADGGINLGANTITLSSPWPATWGVLPAGTAVSNGSNGGNYKYIAATNQNAPLDWEKFAGQIGGVDYSGTNIGTMFPPGTAGIRLLFLTNYQTGASGGRQVFSALSFSIKHKNDRVRSIANISQFFPEPGLVDVYEVYAQASGLTISTPLGGVPGNRIQYRIKDNGTARGISWTGAIRAIGRALPTTTTVGKWHIVDTQYNAIDNVWDAWVTIQDSPPALDAEVVKLTGTQTVAGVKTFSNSPIVPTPTTDMQAATKKYVDDTVGGLEVGDMEASVYDPNEVGGDAFDMDNMVEGTDSKIFTASERSSVASAVQPEDLATVATSGDYDDLSNTPSIPSDFDDLTAGATNKAFTETEKTKLAGVATGATANSTDSQLRDRSTHTGTQAISTISGLQSAIDEKSDFQNTTFSASIPSGNIIALDDLAGGWSDEYSQGTVQHISSGQFEGQGAISITVPSSGSAAGMSKTVTEDYSTSNFRILVKSTDWANTGSANIMFKTDDSNYFSMHLKTFFQDFQDNEWYDCAFSRGQFTVTGSPSWANITEIVLRAWTDSGGAPTIFFDGLAEYPQAQRGVVSITFDDGWDTCYTEGALKMADYGYQGTQFIIPSLLGQAGRMTQDQVDDLHRKGWDISGHGATDLTSLTVDQVSADLKDAALYLNEHGYRGAHLYAYPNGQNNQAVRDEVQKYFPIARTINWSNQPLGYVNPLHINAFSPINSTPTATIQARIDEALNSGTWLILCFHKIVSSPSVSTEYSIANFGTIVDYLKSNNVDVQPVSRVLNRSDFFLDIPVDVGDVTAASSFGTDNRLVRSDGTGKDVQGSGVSVDDSNNVSGVNQFTAVNTITLDGIANAFMVLDRNATSNFAAFQFKTNGTTQATVGMYNNTSTDLVIQKDNADAGRRQLLVFKANSETVFNEEGGDQDLRVEGDTDQNLIRVDAGNDRVGIGTSSPVEKLDVSGNIAVSGTVDGRDIAADGSKLDGVEVGADVTDAGNVGSSIHGASAKTAPVDADTVSLIDSAASNVLKKLSWSNIKATLKTYFDTVFRSKDVYTVGSSGADYTNLQSALDDAHAGSIKTVRVVTPISIASMVTLYPDVSLESSGDLTPISITSGFSGGVALRENSGVADDLTLIDITVDLSAKPDVGGIHIYQGDNVRLIRPHVTGQSYSAASKWGIRVGHYVDGDGSDTASSGMLIENPRIDNCDCGTFEQMLIVNQQNYRIVNPRFENNTNSLAYELMLYINNRNGIVESPHFETPNAHSIGIMESEGLTISNVSANYDDDFALVTFINAKDVSINRVSGRNSTSSPTNAVFKFFDRTLGPDGFTQIVDDTCDINISDVNTEGWKCVVEAQTAGTILTTDYTMNQHDIAFENIIATGLQIPFNIGVDKVENTLHDWYFNNVVLLDWSGTSAGAFQLRGYASDTDAMYGFRFRHCRVAPSTGGGSNAAIRAISMVVDSVEDCDLTGTFTGYGALSTASGGVFTRQFNNKGLSTNQMNGLDAQNNRITSVTNPSSAQDAATKNYADGLITTHAAVAATHGATGAIVGTTNSQTLTNKRITPRAPGTPSAGTVTPTSDASDIYRVTALSTDATIAAPSGTPTDGQKLILRLKDNGTTRSLTWNAIYRAIGVTLPTTTVISKTVYIGMVYNSADSKWDVVAVGQEA